MFLHFTMVITAVITAHRKASFTSAVCATAYPSVRPSVVQTLVLCQKQANAEGCSLHDSVAQSL